MTSARTAREDRATKVAAARAAAERSQHRRRRSVAAALAVVVLLLVVGVGALVQAGRDGSTATAAAPRGTTGTAGQSIPVGRPQAPVTVAVYEDFQCPACKAFEQSTGATLTSLVDQGKVRVDYRPIAILDRFSSTEYSTRALSAAGCVVDQAPNAYTAFHDALFAEQPAENSAGLTDARLAEVATRAGAPAAASCITDRRFTGWAGRVTDQSSKDQVTGTPTVLVAGKALDDTSPQGLQAAVAAAAR